MNFWTKIAGLILRNRYSVLVAIAIITGLLASQMKYMKFSYTEANLLPEDHFWPLNKFHDDQEVTRKAHLVNYF